MHWPSKRNSEVPPVPIPETFLPYWAEPEPERYGPEWVIEHASKQVQPLLAKVLPEICPIFETSSWQVRWDVPNSWAIYRGKSRLWIRMVKTYFEAIIWTPFLRVPDGGKKQNFRRHVRFTAGEEVTPEAVTHLQEGLRILMDRTDQHFAVRE